MEGKIIREEPKTIIFDYPEFQSTVKEINDSVLDYKTLCKKIFSVNHLRNFIFHVAFQVQRMNRWNLFYRFKKEDHEFWFELFETLPTVFDRVSMEDKIKKLEKFKHKFNYDDKRYDKQFKRTYRFSDILVGMRGEQAVRDKIWENEYLFDVMTGIRANRQELLEDLETHLSIEIDRKEDKLKDMKQAYEDIMKNQL